MSARVAVRHRSVLPRVAPLLAAVVLSTAGCGARGGGASPAAGSEVNMGNTGKALSMPAAAGKLADSAYDGGSAVQKRAVISNGSIELTSGDVAATRTRLDAVLTKDGGRVADENTTTDDQGTVTHSHLVVRVPSTRFDDAMTSLSEIASLRSSSRKAQDVTTQVIDLHARIAAERAGVQRLQHLVSQTANLRALLDVERALTERQGELESLRQQAAYLADQTSLATITVDVTLRTTPPPPQVAAGGFVGGLGHGWNALLAVITGFLVGLGALIPFAVAGALVGVPAWLVVRRMRRTRRPRAPAES
jgi:hypothetical protein